MVRKQLVGQGKQLNFTGLSPDFRRIFRLNRFEFLLSERSVIPQSLSAFEVAQRLQQSVKMTQRLITASHVARAMVVLLPLLAVAGCGSPEQTAQKLL